MPRREIALWQVSGAHLGGQFASLHTRALSQWPLPSRKITRTDLENCEGFHLKLSSNHKIIKQVVSGEADSQKNNLYFHLELPSPVQF